MSRKLDIPPAAAADPRSVELARVWAAEGVQHVTLLTSHWSDPAAWGICLVDLARHLARAYEQCEGKDQTQTLARIKEGFDAEWDSPTDDPKGTMLTRE